MWIGSDQEEKRKACFFSSRSECKILKRSINQLELGFFDNLVRIQLEGKNIGRVASWAKAKEDEENNIECQILYSTDGKISSISPRALHSVFAEIENLNASQQLAYELLKSEINTYWNRPLISSISMSFLIEFLRQLIEYSLIANNFSRTLIVCLESLPCKLIDNKYIISIPSKENVFDRLI